MFLRTRRAGRAPTTNHDSSESGVARPAPVGRRKMLRLGGMAAAGAAGAVIVSAVNAPSANAESVPGQPLIIGEGNTGEKTGTTLIAANPNVATFSGINDNGGQGLMGSAGPGGIGVLGQAQFGNGVVGQGGGSSSPTTVYAGVLGQGGTSNNGVGGVGVRGIGGPPNGIGVQAIGNPVPASGRVPVAGTVPRWTLSVSRRFNAAARSRFRQRRTRSRSMCPAG